MNADDKKRKPKRQRGHRRGRSVSWRVFGMLVIFVVIMLCTIWIFQVELLNKFYHRSKMEELSITRSAICDAIDDGKSIDRVVSRQSYQFDTCISVYKMVGDNQAKEVTSSHVNATCLIHHMLPNALSRLYSEAKSQGGEYIDNWKRNPDQSDVTSISTIHASIHTDSKGNEYVLILNSEIEPLNATVITLERQYGWIAGILVIGALILALIIARTVCSPLEKMGKSAKRLARGDYSADFGRGNYREAQELADALNYASCELKKNDSLQRELVANISHDLRTPLTLIKGYGEVMIDIPDENTPENIRIIIDETERLTSLVNDMLDLSKIQAGTRKPEREEFNLTEAVREVMTRYQKLTEKDGYDISFISDSDIYVYADKTMMLQVVYNLVNNAINYTGDDKMVVVSQTVSGNKVKISVRDTGRGIAPEDLQYIWDRYYKVDKIHKRAQIGTGLGLSIVKGILEAHSISYGVESKMDEGSVFWFDMEAIDSKNN